MKFLLYCLLFLSISAVSTAQCPVIQAAMVNACGSNEGNNEYILFKTTSAGFAGNYTFFYGNNPTPSLGLPVNILSGSNATAPTGTGSITSSNGCTITEVTSPVTVIPAGSQVLFIPSGFDANYDVSAICAANNLYVVYIDITSLPSTWNTADMLPNAPTVTTYLEIRKSGAPCGGTVVSYTNGWVADTDGNTVWWDGSGNATYGNNGCGIIAPPVTLSNIVTTSVCAGSTSSLTSFTTTGSPDLCSVTWDAVAIAAGFTDIVNAPLPSSPYPLPIPAGAPAAMYNATVVVKNSATGVSSTSQYISVTTTVPVTTPIFSPVGDICDLAVVPLLPAVSNNGIPGTWMPAVISNTASGIYKFTPASGSCAAFVSLPVTILPLPLASVSGGATICSGTGTNITFNGTPNAVVTFNINGGVSQTVQEDAFGNAVISTAFLYAPVTYNLVSAANTGANTCSQPVSGTAVVSLNPIADATISGTTTICSGTSSTVSFNGTPNATIVYNVNGNSNQTITLDASGTAQLNTGNITLTALYQLISITSASPQFCTAPLAGSATITVKSLPAAAITGPVSICNGMDTTINFNGTANTDVLYTCDGSTIKTISLGASGTAAINTGVLVASQTYSLISTGYTTGPTCTQPLTGNVIVTVFPVTPVPGVTSPVIYCQKQAATALTATGSNLLWHTTSTSGVPAAPVPVTISAGTTNYFVTQTVNGCEGNPASLNVIVNPTPAVPALSLGSLYRCGPGPTTLKATAPGIVKWYADSALTTYLSAGGAFNTVVSSTTTFYATNTENNCNSVPVSASVLVLPIVTQTTGFSYSPSTVCQGSPKPLPVPVAGFSPGGVFSAASGLSLHAITGAVDPSASVPGTYTVKYSLGAALCTPASFSTSTITITKNPTPPTSFSYASPVCSSASNPSPVPGTGFTSGGVFSGPAGISVNASTGTIDLSASTAGNYTITYSLAATACTNASVSTADLTIVTPPMPTVTNGAKRCGNGTVTITANATGTINWYADAGLTKLIFTGTTYTTSVAAVTNFYITNTAGGCISAKNTATATVVPITPQVTSFSYAAATICSGSVKPVPLPAAGFATGGIYSSATGLSIDSVTGIIDPALSMAGSYTVKYTLPSSACALIASSTTGIVVTKTLPTVTAFSYPSPVCIATPNTLPTTAAGFTTGGVYSSSAGLVINAVTGLIDIAASTPATYTVAYSVAQTTCGAAGSSTADITITPSSAAPVAANQQRCGPGTITLTATANGTIKWYADAGLSTLLYTGLSYTPAVTSTIDFYLTNTAGSCVSSASIVKATVNPMTSQVTDFSYNPGTVCAANANPIPSLAAGFSIGGTFTSSAALSINVSTGVINIAASTPGSYIVKYTLPNGVCAVDNNSTSPIIITDNATPVTAFSYASPVCSNAVNAAPLTANGFSTGGVFSAGTGLSVDAATGVVDIAKSISGTYTVNYNKPATLCTPGSTSNADITISKAPAPPVTTGNHRCGSGTINLSATGNGSLQWYSDPGLNNLLATGLDYSPVLNNTSTLYVTAFDGTCNSNAVAATGTVFQMPAIPSLGKYSSICTGDKLVLSPGTYDHYLWQDNSTAASFTVTTEGNYAVKVTTADGCSDSAAISIVLSHKCDDILFPTAFSPNGDGLNDNFGPLPLRNLAFLKNYSLRIYNRYGQVVFSSNNPYEKWDGGHRGQSADTGSFIWKAVYIYDGGNPLSKEGAVIIVH